MCGYLCSYCSFLILSQVQEFEYKVIFSLMSSIVIIHWIPCTVHETVWSVDWYILVTRWCGQSTCILLSRDGVVSRLVYSCHEMVWSVDLYTLVTRWCGQSTCILLSRDGVVSRFVYSCHEMVWSVDLYTLVTRRCGQSTCILLSSHYCRIMGG